MIDLQHVTCCLITKEPRYPEVVLYHVAQFPFGELLILTHSDSPYRKHELFAKAKYDLLYYQDDDAVAPIDQLAAAADPAVITCAMKTHHLQQYANSRMALLGWGTLFDKSKLQVLDRYRERWGEDALFKRETERILTYLNYPQLRLDLPIADTPAAFAADRLSFQPHHYDYIRDVTQRCDELLAAP